MFRKSLWKPNHPLATKNKKVVYARYIFYEAHKNKKLRCNWCNMELVWIVGILSNNTTNAVCIDHLDRNPENNELTNLVAACRECNANRHKNGRRKPRTCPICAKDFLPRRPETVFCSNHCASQMRPKRIIKMKHGTRSRYTHGCRCNECRKANAEYSAIIYKKRNKTI